MCYTATLSLPFQLLHYFAVSFALSFAPPLHLAFPWHFPFSLFSSFLLCAFHFNYFSNAADAAGNDIKFTYAISLLPQDLPIVVSVPSFPDLHPRTAAALCPR